VVNLFFPLEIKKTSFFCWKFQNSRGTKSPPSDAHGYKSRRRHRNLECRKKQF